MAANQTGLSRGLSSNFCSLRSTIHMKFTEECVICMKKHVFGKRTMYKWAKYRFVTTSLLEKTIHGVFPITNSVDKIHLIYWMTLEFLKSFYIELLSLNKSISLADEELSHIGERSCFNRPKEETWSEKLPISYEKDGQWKLVGCRNNISTKEQYESCLSGKTVILHGDYSLKQIFNMFAR